MATSADLQIVIDAIADGMRRELKRAEGDLKKFSKQADRELQSVDSGFAKLGSSIKGMLAGISVAAAVGGLTALTKSALQVADAVDKASQRAGVSASEWQRLNYAAGLAGVSAEQLETALRQLNMRLAEGKVEGRNTGEALRLLADRLAAAKTGHEQVAIAAAAMGEEGARMLPLLNQGAAALDRATGEADKYGQVLSDTAVKGGAQFNDELAKLNQMLRTQLAEGFLRQLTAEVDEFGAAAGDAQLQADIQNLGGLLGWLAGEAMQTAFRLAETAAAARELRALDAGKAYLGRSPEARAAGAAWEWLTTEPGEWAGSYGASGWSGSAGSLADTSRDEGLKIELTRPAGVTPAAPKVRSGGGGRVRSGGGSRTAIAQAAEDSADFAQVLREVESEFRDAQRVIESTRTPMERYGAEVRKLDRFLASGMISQETYSRAMVAAMEDLDSATASTAQVTDRASEAAEALGLSFSSAFEDAILSGGRLRDILRGLGEDIARIAIRQTITAPMAGALTQLIGGVTGSLFGGGGGLMAAPGSSSTAAQMSAIRGAFADGGWVRGVGTGTSDSILARLSNGEFVVPADVAKANRGLLENLPKFAAGGFVGRAPTGGGGGSLQVVLENKSSQPLKLESQRQERGPDGKAIIRVLVTDAFKDALRAGELDGSMRTRYGAAVQPIGR